MNLAILTVKRQLSMREWRTGALFLLAALLPGAVVILPLLWWFMQRFGRARALARGDSDDSTHL
jgi:hypothetical protein